jgi:DNA-binding NarL/FixJ family response regulator
MDDETKARIEELAARIDALAEEHAAIVDALRLIYTRLTEAEAALVGLHDRTATCELAVERSRDVLRAMAEGLEVLLRRAAGGKPPGPAAPLSGVN